MNDMDKKINRLRAALAELKEAWEDLESATDGQSGYEDLFMVLSQDKPQFEEVTVVLDEPSSEDDEEKD